ncbi:MAG TPA: T9SS type A sorting domain-containing protein [Candidatus Kapabacteria bacterium]|nr:T9SS type A sorting domain-containing protein [Candidatus Kapabacteria bacterium]
MIKKTLLIMLFIPIFYISSYSQICLSSWGQNTNGQLGNGTIIQKNLPEQITYDVKWKVISSGYQHSFGIKSDNSLWAWGDNSAGQLGIQDSIYIVRPHRVDNSNDWTSVSCGYGHTLAIKQDGTLWACGYNAFGQLGDGTSINRASFVQIGTANNWSKVSAGGYHNLAIKTDGTLWVWGDNQYGQLGNNFQNHRIPSQVGNNNDWIAIAAGESYSHAIKQNLEEKTSIYKIPIRNSGTLWAWGNNLSGQLGNGNFGGNIKFPVQIGSSDDWEIIENGGGHTFAIKEDGTLWAWGSNIKGKLGLGDENERSITTQVGTESNWCKVKCGEGHTLALKNDGTLWACGNNSEGQLGKNYPVNSNIFIKLDSNNWYNITCGGFFSMALRNDYTVPILVSPNNNKEKLPTTILFQWRPFPNTINYNLQVAKDNDFNNVVVNNSDILDTFAIINLEINTKYYWRVRAASNTIVTEWSVIWTFKTIIEQIKIPTLIYPNDYSSDLPVIIDFLWEQQDDVQLYNIQISNDNSFNSLLIDSTLNSNHISKLLSYNTIYYWRVRAINYDYYTAWSDIYTFKTKTNSGIEDNLLTTNMFTFFPNPAKDYLNIICNFTNDNLINLRIIDLLGNQLFNKNINIENNKISLPIEFLNSGLYILMLNIDNHIYAKKLIINN